MTNTKQYIELQCIEFEPRPEVKDLLMAQHRKFAYDPQLSLFPDPVKEEARKKSREAFDSGKEPKVIYLKVDERAD